MRLLQTACSIIACFSNFLSLAQTGSVKLLAEMNVQDNQMHLNNFVVQNGQFYLCGIFKDTLIFGSTELVATFPGVSPFFLRADSSFSNLYAASYKNSQTTSIPSDLEVLPSGDFLYVTDLDSGAQFLGHTAPDINRYFFKIDKDNHSTIPPIRATNYLSGSEDKLYFLGAFLNNFDFAGNTFNDQTGGTDWNGVVLQTSNALLPKDAFYLGWPFFRLAALPSLQIGNRVLAGGSLSSFSTSTILGQQVQDTSFIHNIFFYDFDITDPINSVNFQYGDTGIIEHISSLNKGKLGFYGDLQRNKEMNWFGETLEKSAGPATKFFVQTDSLYKAEWIQYFHDPRFLRRHANDLMNDNGAGYYGIFATTGERLETDSTTIMPAEQFFGILDEMGEYQELIPVSGSIRDAHVSCQGNDFYLAVIITSDFSFGPLNISNHGNKERLLFIHLKANLPLPNAIEKLKTETYSSVKLYPNPAQDKLTIESQHEIHSMKIYDIQGRLVMHETLHGQKEVGTNISKLKNGLYQIVLNTSSVQLKSKFEVIR